MDYLIGHLVGDYLLQTDYQAQNKKKPGLKGLFACVIHCLLWTISVLIFTGWNTWLIAVLVFLSHIVLDRTYIIPWFLKIAGKERSFWLIVGCDNVTHLVFLWLIAKYIV